MSAWGPGLYSGDVAADVKGLFAELVSLPYDAGRLIEIAAATIEASRPGNDSYSAFWLAAADQLYSYGVRHAPTAELANRLIRSGADLIAMRGLGMSEKDLARRAKVLGELAAKWAEPNPKPKNRKVLAEPEPFLFEEGEVVLYPTARYAPINPYFSQNVLAGWSPDGWGAFIVLRHFRRLEFFAVSLIGFLLPRPLDRVGIGRYPGPDAVAILHLITVSPAHAKKMRLESIGRLPVDSERVSSLPTNRYPFIFGPAHLCNALHDHSHPDPDLRTGDPENAGQRDDAIPLYRLLSRR